MLPFNTKPIARWTIGNVSSDGFDCLAESMKCLLSQYDLQPVVCYNCDFELLEAIKPNLPTNTIFIDQHSHLSSCSAMPVGVAWKLYPPRINIDKHEIVIDNDLVINYHIQQIDDFLGGTHTLMLEENSRTYGRFEKMVPVGLTINSGLYGMPPQFDLQGFVKFYCGDEWEENARGEHRANRTFDEQGLVAFALSSYRKYDIIPSTCITNCEQQLIEGKGCHFIGLNRRSFHRPYRLYKCRNCKLHL